jgi:hypothetical protein
MTLIVIASLLALVIAVDALRRTVTAWNAVLDQNATLEDILHLTGFSSEREVKWTYGRKQKDERYFQVNVEDILTKQTKAGRVFGDPVFDVMVAIMVTVAIMSQSIPLMISATTFVMLWHVVGKNTAPTLQKNKLDPFDFDDEY